MQYVALQVKTCYSILESLNKIDSLILKAKQLGYKSLAITDNNNMFGVPEFYQKCKIEGIKPIIGLSITIRDNIFLLYAINNNGYNNLIKLSTILSEKELTIEDLKKYKDNLLLVMPYSSYNEDIYQIYSNKYIGYSSLKERESITQKDKILINDVSYINEEDYKYIDYLYMIKESKVLGEYPLETHIGHHLLTEEDINKLSTEEDIKNTEIISNLCNVELNYQKDLLPTYDSKIDAYEYLNYLCNCNNLICNKIGFYLSYPV